VGLIAASGAGIALAIVLFIRDRIRDPVLRKHANLQEISSKMRRRESEREILNTNGNLAVVADLQSNLFFGTTDQLFTELEADLGICRWMLFDMRRVQSMDYTAANLFHQMHQRLQERDGALLLCGMPSHLSERQDIQRYLLHVGLLGETGDNIEVFDTRDEGLEWMENRILESAGISPAEVAEPSELAEIEFLSDLDSSALDELERCVRNRSVGAGEKVFNRGDTGDEIYLIRSGVVRALLPLPHGKRHHLATFGRGDFFGEMAFLDRETRSADAEAKTACELYVLSRAEFDRHMRAVDPASGMRVFERLARAVSLRLRQTDMELRASEDR
jgi:SulP family sulfate permease